MHAGKDDLEVVTQVPGFESRGAEWGGFTAAIETIAGPQDFKEAFSDLPDGRCQSPHWGYVVSGTLRIDYPDHEEVVGAGEIYYMPPGHIPATEKDTVLVEFSPLGDYQDTLKRLEESQ